ncbi:uncharacterized protein K460DRAFT_351795 [Cucurbitaria berberidis CBS 394.84]|uniref:DUF262 domain-containing protein n=1 Tax=Cucurbitaria berberidis CBS 394.84 TaxID=1168544 RepID=A0A9P4LDI9_9PLEO|nr:uncharacterized protein K460DRAFT_351795 [Cucurbitaria berberidis CBS 394.84]KAF1851931.1 hypothetical protein K460DRAFT_351795 [Cucurbitaria berberidis CBS 394.84]
MEMSTNNDTSQHSDSAALQHSVKDELADNEDFLWDGVHDESTYKPRPQLPKSFVGMRTLAHLMSDLENGIIDVDPEYQRDIVWAENYYIPPIILDKKKQTSQDGGKPQVTLVCVDGKQRLSSVQAFIKGMIPCHDHRGEKWWFCDTPGSRRKKILCEETRELFLSKEFVCFEFTDLSSEQEEDLFARVQMGVQLTLAEKMRASTGPWQELARLFVDDFSVIYSLMRDRARAKDFQLTLSCFSQIVEVMHPTAANGIPVLKTNYAALPKLLGNKSAVDDGIKSHLANVWNTLKDLIELDPDTFTNADKYLWGVKTFAPVEMVAVTVLISQYSETQNHQLLLKNIKDLRVALRGQFVDLRLNSTVWKFVWDFIEGLDVVQGALDGSTSSRNPSEQPASASAATPSGQKGRPSGSTNPRIILPPQKLVTMKQEEAKSTASSDFRSPKRRRTDSSLEDGMSPAIKHSNGTAASPLSMDRHTASWAPQSIENSHTRPSFTSTPLYNAPLPTILQHPSITPEESTSMETTHASAALSLRCTKTPTQLHQAGSIQTASTPTGTPASQEVSGISARRQSPSMYTPAQMSLPTPAQVRQTRVSELNNYRAPNAPMGLSTPVVPMSQLAPASPMRLNGTPTLAPLNTNMSQIRQPSNSKSTLRTGIGAFAPSHTERQWEGVLKSASPPTPQQILSSAVIPSPSSSVPELASSTPLSQPRPNRRSRRSGPRPTPAQYSGAIDLTIDSDAELEQERQDILSSFKGKSATGTQPEGSSATASAPMQRFPVAGQHTEAEDLPKRRNPYAKFKEN